MHKGLLYPKNTLFGFDFTLLNEYFEADDLLRKSWILEREHY